MARNKDNDDGKSDGPPGITGAEEAMFVVEEAYSVWYAEPFGT